MPTPEPSQTEVGHGHWARDKFLWLALAFALLFCAYGMHWGVAEAWDPDQFVYRNLFSEDRLPFEPPHFLKPPFHTYLSFLLVRAPIYVLSQVFGVPDHYRRIVELLCAHLLTAVMFMGQVILVFVITKRFFGAVAARAASLLLATSAGFIAFSHLLTVDIPVTFWMLLAFWSSQNILLRGRSRDYILAGFFTGIAASTKYNGLAIGISIVVAHWLSIDAPAFSRKRSVWQRRLLDPRLIAGICMVVVGFVLTNPFTVLDYSEFAGDFIYNLVTAQYYAGADQASHYGYWTFWQRFADLFGVPGAILIGGGITFAALRLLVGRPRRLEVHGVLMLAAVVVLYYAYFGSFGRLPTRFVLPVGPYGLMLIGPLCAAIRPRHVMFALSLPLLYSAVCSVAVGWRFTHDPRMAARHWIYEHMVEGSTVEHTPNTPNPERFLNKRFEAVLFPRMTGRIRMFEEIVADHGLDAERMARAEGTDANVAWYTAQRLSERSPDYIWLDSLDYENFLSGLGAKYYPEVEGYYRLLLEEEGPYHIVYDAASSDWPSWLYPARIYEVDNRITILQRQPKPSDGEPSAEPNRP